MSYFVKLVNDAAIRVNVLETSKKVVHSMQNYYNLLEIRKQKLEIMELLRTEFKEITLLISKLNELLPDKDLLKEPLPKEAKVTSSKKTAKDVVQAPPDIDKLSQVLNNIENKLKELK